MFNNDEYNYQITQKDVEELFLKLGIETKINGHYIRNFAISNLHTPTGRYYSHNTSKRTKESIEWVFYSGHTPHNNDPNPIIILGEYYQTGMRHDIVLFHNNNGFPQATLGSTSYLYRDELEANQNAGIDHHPNWPYPNAAHYSRLEVDDIKRQTISTALLLKIQGDEFHLDAPVNIDRTTLHFRKFLTEPLFQGYDEGVPEGKE